jgi:glucose-6-phosphate isomerase
MISLDTTLLKNHIHDHEIEQLQKPIEQITTSLQEKTCTGSDFLGWLDLPYQKNNSELDKIQNLAKKIREKSDYFISVGIGGSYLGARATIECLTPGLRPTKPEILFFGHHLNAEYATEVLDSIKNKNIYVNVISKSGTTTEPGIAFRLLRDFMEKNYSPDELKRRIITTTDKQKGALRKLTDEKGYENFIIPDDVGGRFSVLTPVGLLPIAVAGIDINELLNGAKKMADTCLTVQNIKDNPALLYAVSRYLLYQKGKSVEILSSFDPYMHYVSEWWKQLFGESEGKDGKGIFPASADFTTDLHSLGQFIQDGFRSLFETFLIIDQPNKTVKIPDVKDDRDGMNYLVDENLNQINHQAYKGTAIAHYDGGVPSMTIRMPKKNAFYLGQLFFLFEFAVAVSGLLAGVNPFDQPGVEDYKNNMFALLGKPGHEKRKTELENRLKNF